jgi:uncharacterized membrane protein
MVLDFLISIIILIIDNTIVRFFPNEITGLSLSQFNSGFNTLYSSYQQSFNLIQSFLDVKLLFSLLSIVLLAEFMLHFGFKGIKWLINVIRGSGA